MPNARRSLRWREAALGLEASLREATCVAPERLPAAALAAAYPNRSWCAGWRVPVAFSDGKTRHIDILATSGFPEIPVRTALVEHPEFMTWPHVESDGVLCLLPNLAEFDPADSGGVALNLLNRSTRLIEELLEGSIIERDFREEFLTYWAYKSHRDGSRLLSLLTPAPPSRLVRVWRGSGVEVVGENEETVSRWVSRRFGKVPKTRSVNAAFLWLDQPLLPAAYPDKAADLHDLATGLGDAARSVLEEAGAGTPNHLLAVLGSVGRGGPGLVAVKVPNPQDRGCRHRSSGTTTLAGFRPGKAPRELMASRYFGNSPVIRSMVDRADAEWVHGRGRDLRTQRLLQAKVIVIGCGSVGAPVAAALAQAGVGTLHLIDMDVMSWANVGRHPLGASEVGRNKAIALAERLQANYPHLEVHGHDRCLQDVVLSMPSLLSDADLIIAATGSWAADYALNTWHIEIGREKPIMYAWTEAHACAGHGVVVAKTGGCFRCHIGRTGAPSFTVVDWPNGLQTEEEPACGAHYQPYGPVELSFITAMISELSLDCVLDAPTHSTHRVIAASPHRITQLGGRLSKAWRSEQNRDATGIVIVEREWPSATCPACRSALD